ncbi:YcgL domain-containing protein [Aliikangiella maris]|uniref:YcgL domain-containing protein ABVT42_04015 n=2 Tax=Aliikangiella maris TaxID=3162458 RepID=A0ABV3MJW5_9GAMM
MLASVYRSNKKDEMYLYISVKDDFSQVPESLMKIFGKPEFALQINLGKRDKLSRVDIEEVKTKLQEDGYFLQMPPSIHDNLAGILKKK